MSTTKPRRSCPGLKELLSLVLDCTEHGIKVNAPDGDDGPLFQLLIEDWVAVQIRRMGRPGNTELCPVLDDSLNMLAGLNWAERLIVSYFPKDDPHRRTLAAHFDLMDNWLRQLMDGGKP